MADYDPMGLAVQRMDDDSPADMFTVFNDTNVTETLTSTMMVAVTTMRTTMTTTQVTTSGRISSTSADGSRHTEGTVGSRIISRLEGLQLNVDQPQYGWDTPDQQKEFRIFCKQLTSWFNLQCVRNYMARDAKVCCLGKKGYILYDKLVADPVTKADWWEFLRYFKLTLDNEVGPQV